MKILLAEDDANISVIAKLALEKFGGHQVTAVSDGDQALFLGLNGNFDLILLDEMMPKMNGLMVSSKLREKGRTVPIIFLSAKSQESDVKEFYARGNGFIPKPFDPITLVSQINQILAVAA